MESKQGVGINSTAFLYHKLFIHSCFMLRVYAYYCLLSDCKKITKGVLQKGLVWYVMVIPRFVQL